MESVKPSAVTPAKSRLARTFAKVLHIRAVTGVAPVDGVDKVKDNTVKPKDKFKDDHQAAGVAIKPPKVSWSQLFGKEDTELEYRISLEAFLAKLFASISTVKSSYVQLQHALIRDR